MQARVISDRYCTGMTHLWLLSSLCWFSNLFLWFFRLLQGKKAIEPRPATLVFQSQSPILVRFFPSVLPFLLLLTPFLW
jgi:hypothetical protein